MYKRPRGDNTTRDNATARARDTHLEALAVEPGVLPPDEILLGAVLGVHAAGQHSLHLPSICAITGKNMNAHAHAPPHTHA